MTCSTCAYATEHGWWGPGHKGTHCRGCHRSFVGGGHCDFCHRHFGGSYGFKLHLRAAPNFETAPPAQALICLDPAEVGLVPDDKGIWRRPPPPLRLTDNPANPAPSTQQTQEDHPCSPSSSPPPD